MKKILEFRKNKPIEFSLIICMFLATALVGLNAQSIQQTNRGLDISMDLQGGVVKTDINGNRYLFDTFEQDAYVKLIDSPELVLVKNANVDGYLKQLHYILSDGLSVTTRMILPNNVEYFTINGRKFNIMFYKDDSWVFETVAEGFYKTFETEIIPASSNPMVNRPVDKFVFKTIYLVVYGEGVLDYKRVSKRKFNQLLKNK